MTKTLANLALIAAAVVAFAASNSVAQAGHPRSNVIVVHSQHNFRPQLGIVGQPVLGKGVVVQGVLNGSIAHHAGIKRGDAIVGVNNRRIRSEFDVISALGNSGGVVDLLVLDGRSHRLVPVRVLLSRTGQVVQVIHGR
jgi:S1-C subfamily serine protease